MDWWRGSDLGWCCSRHRTKGVQPQAVRRRNRARHTELARDEIFEAVAQPHYQTFGEQFADQREWFDMNDEYQCPSNEVWRALMENDYGLGSVDFDGTYTVETK